VFILIVGGGKVGSYLTRALINQGHEVLVIEKNDISGWGRFRATGSWDYGVDYEDTDANVVRVPGARVPGDPEGHGQPGIV